jgi:hypothetical protein
MSELDLKHFLFQVIVWIVVAVLCGELSVPPGAAAAFVLFAGAARAGVVAPDLAG